MDENDEKSANNESAKSLAFTIDFGEGKSVDTQRHKILVEKYQKKHRRGQSLSKIETPPVSSAPKKHPLTGNLPRKASFQSEGYFSSDEKSSDRNKNVRASAKRSELSLPLKNVVIPNKMTQSFPNETLFNAANSLEIIEIKDISSPELDLVSPYSPKSSELPTPIKLIRQCSNPERESENYTEANDFDFDKSDTVSDAGTYTLDADNYSEEQKARMSIDAEFKIEQISVAKKTELYIKSLSNFNSDMSDQFKDMCLVDETESQITPKIVNAKSFIKNKMLSPILSPTQNLSITDQKLEENHLNNGGCDLINKTFTKIMFPSPQARGNGLGRLLDQGSVISVTSSGAFRTKSDKIKRKLSLTKSEVHVEAYVGDKIEKSEIVPVPKLTANIVNIQNISIGDEDNAKITNHSSPTKIPSPIHTLSRPRSRNSVSSLNIDLSDSSLETESYLKPTQNYINTLQQKLSLDSDQESDDFKSKCNVKLNNTSHNLLKQKATHIRHNSLDDRNIKIYNKLEHFQNKNLQSIDQTYNMFNQYNQNRVMHKIQNSPNNSPIKRSSSFSTKNTNLAIQKESNVARNSPISSQRNKLQKSSSTANIKPTFDQLRRSSVSSDHKKIDRNQFGDTTESSSEEDFDKHLLKKKDLTTSNLTNTRYNRTFNLRRARLDSNEPIPRCPNTPEMRRKFQPDHGRFEQRAISVDRKPVKTNDIQSRYLLSAGRKATPVKAEPLKLVPKFGGVTAKTIQSVKPTTFSRTDSGRFSMRAVKPPVSGGQKSGKRDGSGKKSGGRSNSSLSSREVEFQNWKRRKSYDPMKAAAEGKRKEIAKKQNIMTQSCMEANQNQDCDSSPSHSSSVHRSQSFHGTAALEQLISSEEEDLTLSADEGFSPPTPSPCELSPARASLRNAWKEHILR